MGYDIITDNLKITDVIAQVRAVNEFPATIKIYDRVIRVMSFSERYMLLHGLEVGFFIGEEFAEGKTK